MMFYYLGIIAFALRVYPSIPIAKGGGNYAESPRVRITFRPTPGVPPTLVSVNATERALSESNSFVIIEKTPTSIFVADVHDEGGPASWTEMRRLPGIIEVHREIIDRIVYTQTSITNHESVLEQK